MLAPTMMSFLRHLGGTFDGNATAELEFPNPSNFSYSSPLSVPHEKLERGGGICFKSRLKSGVWSVGSMVVNFMLAGVKMLLLEPRDRS